MTPITRNEFDRQAFQKIDPRPDQEKQAKADTKLFWCLWIPLGLVAGFFACVMGGSGAFLIPVWGVTTIVLWAGFGRSSE